MVLQLPRPVVDPVDPVDAVAEVLLARYTAGRKAPLGVETLVAPLVRASGGSHAPDLEEIAQAFGKGLCGSGNGPLDIVDDLHALRAVLTAAVEATGMPVDPGALDRTVRAALAGSLDVPRRLPPTRDQVTGFLLPSVFTEVLACEVEAAARHGQPTLLVVHAPTVAEQARTKGRLAGDLVKVRLATALRATARRSDVLGLLDDEDGALSGVLLPRTDALRAQAVVRRLLSRLETMDRDVRSAPAKVAGLHGGRRGTFCVGVGYLPDAGTAHAVVAAALDALTEVRALPVD